MLATNALPTCPVTFAPDILLKLLPEPLKKLAITKLPKLAFPAVKLPVISKLISVPRNTYLSIPFLAKKLNIELCWKEEDWKDYYYLAAGIIDAAVLWKPKSYVPNTFMGISFQYQKHLSLGRGGILLVDNSHAAEQIKKMSYDGRLPNIPWRDQNINTVGYHYYMTPETAQLGLDKLPKAIETEPRQWTVNDWPDLTQMEIFKK